MAAIRALRVTTLTPDRFEAQADTPITPPPGFGRLTDGLHTLSAAGPVTLIDAKRFEVSPRSLALDVRREWAKRGPGRDEALDRRRAGALGDHGVEHLQIGLGDRSQAVAVDRAGQGAGIGGGSVQHLAQAVGQSGGVADRRHAAVQGSLSSSWAAGVQVVLTTGRPAPRASTITAA